MTPIPKDPYKYFRVEARELLDGLAQGVLQWEKSFSADLCARLLRLAHTFKGAARVVRQPEIAELAHKVEELLATHRAVAEPLSRDQASAVLRVLDEMSSRVRALDPEVASPSAAAPHPVVDESFDTVRVELKELDAMVRDFTEAGVQLGALQRETNALDHLKQLATKAVERLSPRRPDGGTSTPALLAARSVVEDIRAEVDRLTRRMTTDLQRVEASLAGSRDAAQRIRLVPAQTLFPGLERAVRDAAQVLGRNVDFVTSGGDVRLDAGVLAAVRDALLHVVRNAVAHGIETETERRAASKAPAGRVALHVERRGGRVALSCQDDGRGIDVDAVKSAALSLGLISPSEAGALTAGAAAQLVLAGGLTTSRDVTQISGRGIGLDVARETAARLKGKLNLSSDPGRGTRVELVVPVSVASFTGLLVEAGGTVAALPLDSVRRTLRATPADIVRSADSESIIVDGHAVAFQSLDRLMERTASDRATGTRSVCLVQSGARLAAIGVDRILGTSSIVMRPLPATVDAAPILGGASLDAEGNPQLVLDPHGLVTAASVARATHAREARRPATQVLVVDDSLTTRMLEKSILESAGYDVDVAVSAEEALKKAGQRTYSIFIVDVEMPGMSGFEFVATIREDSSLRNTPAILVTSRNAPEDRQRGLQAGANAYIVKSEFDQGQLLQTIRQLVS